MTRDMTKLRIDRVSYSPWCDEEGKVLDDGTIARLADDRYRITAADACYRWFVLNATGLGRSDRRHQRRHRRARAAGAPGPRGPPGRHRPGLGRASVLRSSDDRDRGRAGRRHANRLHGRSWLRAVDGRGRRPRRVGQALRGWSAIRDPPRGHPRHGRRQGRSRPDPDRGRVHQRASRHRARTAVLTVRAELRRVGGLLEGQRLQRTAGVARRAEGGWSRATAGGPAPGLGGHRGHVRQARTRLRHQPVRAPRPDPRLQGRQAGRAHDLHHLGTHDQEDDLAGVGRPRAQPPWARALSVEWTVEGERGKVGATVVPMPFFDPERKRS